MELLLLGTAAADSWPAGYCDCAACTEARRRGGPNIRAHSGALIDDDLKIDYGPGTMDHMQRVRRSLGKVRSILFTHDHADHLYATDLRRASPPYTKTRGDTPIVIYGNARVLAEIRRVLADVAKWRLDLRLVQPLEPFTTPTGDTVLPLPAAHCPEALLYRITRGGKTIFYGHDSGYYPQATLDALADGVALDLVLLDCTHGGSPSKCEHHQNIEANLKSIEQLRQRGAIVQRTRLIATHFSHNGGLLHEELVHAFLPHGVEVAFDGMVVRL
ncbi:MAG: MBL fold metallo-hydrolase [Phycisphaeraceae bacterium]